MCKLIWSVNTLTLYYTVYTILCSAISFALVNLLSQMTDPYNRIGELLFRIYINDHNLLRQKLYSPNNPHTQT